MKTSIAVLVQLMVMEGTVYTQQPPPVPASVGPVPLIVPAAPQVELAPSPPKERTINQILDEIQSIRAQKAELEKKEGALMTEVKKQMEKLSERLNKLGIGAPVQPPVAVDFAAPAGGPTTPPPSVPGTPFPVINKR